MKIFREAIIILGIYLIAELISKGLSLPIPGNILGIFLDHLAFFFIPAGVGLITSFDSIKDSLILIILLCIITTSIVIVVTGSVVQFVMNLQKRKTKKGYESKQ